MHRDTGVYGFLRTVARSLIRFVPAKNSIISAAAFLPPSIRSRTSARLLTAIAGRCPELPRELETNLGIDRNLRVRLSSDKTRLLFGAPSLHVGERSSL